MGRLRQFLTRVQARVANHDFGPRPPEGSGLLEDFLVRCRSMDHPRVLELGAARSIPDRSTRRDAWVPDAGAYLGTDLAPGPDVDIPADVHKLADVVGEEQFDVIITCSGFEHFKYPHVAAHQVMRALRVGGVLFIQTHHTFPLHAYPKDYFRFSREALEGLFGTKMGFRIIGTSYEYPAKIYSRENPQTQVHRSFLNVCLYGEKVAPTPREYIYELE